MRVVNEVTNCFGFTRSYYCQGYPLKEENFPSASLNRYSVRGGSSTEYLSLDLEIAGKPRDVTPSSLLNI